MENPCDAFAYDSEITINFKVLLVLGVGVWVFLAAHLNGLH